jgi:ribosomal-protein-alanine acetyltransferase
MNISSSNCDNFKLTEDLKSQIIKMDKEHFPYPWTSSQWEDLFDKDKNYMTLSTNNDLLTGFSLFEINPFEEMAHLYKICVDPAHRKQRIAKKMLNKSDEDFNQLKLKSIFLEVAVNNDDAISLYTGFGFNKLNIIKKFYSDGSDAVAMQKRL